VASPRRNVKPGSLDAGVPAASGPTGGNGGASSASGITKAPEQRRYVPHEAPEPIVQTASPTGGWVPCGAMGLVFLGVCAAAVHFVGLIPTLIGVCVIIWALYRMASSALDDSAGLPKIRG
jgi:hypothetical protein